MEHLASIIKKNKKLYTFLIKEKQALQNHNPVIQRRKRQTYESVSSFLKSSEYWSKERIYDYQLAELKRVIKHAYQYSGFYKKIFEQHGVVPEDLKELGDISKFPIITKELVRDNCLSIVSSKFAPKELQSFSTGGSTGIPLKLYKERIVAEPVEAAFINNIWKRFSYSPADKMVVLTGAVMTPKDGRTYWTKFGPNKLVVSTYNFTEDSIGDYIKAVKEFNPDIIYGYPSAVTLFANLIGKREYKIFPKTRAVICASENIYCWQREIIEGAFQTKSHSHYGHSERTVLAGECEESIRYHIQPEYGYTEILDGNGSPVKDGETGEIVATGFTNYAFPLIRYRTMDFAKTAPGICSCGRNHRLLECMEGRDLDFFVDANGGLYQASGSILVVKEFHDFKKIQFYQERTGEVLVKIVKSRNTDYSDSDLIVKSLENRYKNIVFRIEFAEDIPPLKNGKSLYLIQKLPINFASKQ